MTPATEKSKSAVTVYFRALMAQSGILIRENESVDDYVRRKGFPYTRQVKDWRNDN